MRILIVALFLILLPSYSHAQLDTSILNDTGAFLEFQPEYPNPGDEFTVTLNDYQSSNYGAKIDWTVNGMTKGDSTNQRKITLTAGDAGEPIAVRAVLTNPNGSSDVVARTITPTHLDIIVEPQTHVPDFYRGRALPSTGSTVNLTALLNNGRMMGTDFVYTWRINDTVLDGGPVRGRNKISFVAPMGSNLIISLQVTRPDGTVVAKRSLSIPSVSPEVIFYEANTLYGLSTQALKGSFHLSGNSSTIKAEPYYLDSLVYNQPNMLQWTINNKPAASAANPYEITIERTGYAGTATLGFHVRSTTQLLQGGKGSIKISI